MNVLSTFLGLMVFRVQWYLIQLHGCGVTGIVAKVYVVVVENVCFCLSALSAVIGGWINFHVERKNQFCQIKACIFCSLLKLLLLNQ